MNCWYANLFSANRARSGFELRLPRPFSQLSGRHSIHSFRDPLCRLRPNIVSKMMARRNEAPRSESGVGFLGRGQPTPSHQLSLGSAVSSPSRATTVKRFHYILSTQDALFWHFTGVFVLKTEFHRHTVDCCRNCKSWARNVSLWRLIQFSIAQVKIRFQIGSVTTGKGQLIYFHLRKCLDSRSGNEQRKIANMINTAESVL